MLAGIAVCGRKLLSGTALFLMFVGTTMSGNCEAQTLAVKVHAYERDIIGGIPGGPPGVGAAARQPGYFIYLETPPKTQVEIEGIWMKSGFHVVETAVKPSPVKFDSPVKLADESKSIAVPKTANTVTEIVVKDPVPGKLPDAEASKALSEGVAALQVRSGGRTVYVPIKKFERRDPVYMK
jgi:hypothetical protein